jgi:hypothetical protein
MHEIIDQMMGIDKKKEILDLWYEIVFLRMVLNEILSTNVSKINPLPPGSIQECRDKAQELVRKKFPLIEIDFKEYQN